MEHLDAIKSLVLKKVTRFCGEQGITLNYEDLVKHINITREEVLESQVKPKPKSTKLFIKPKKPKQKLILKVKKSIDDYTTFITICDKNKLHYFQYHDEHSWVGPAINIKKDELSKVRPYFKTLKTTIITGTNFYLIHPTFSRKDDNIKYPIFNHNCKLESNSLIVPNSDDEIYNQTTDDEVELEEWMHEGTNTKYMIDPDTNILYSFQTNEPVGKKIDEFTIDFNYN